MASNTLKTGFWYLESDSMSLEPHFFEVLQEYGGACIYEVLLEAKRLIHNE